MKEPYSEGVASHTGPESCVSGREARDEALTGVRAGRVLSRENSLTSECRRRPSERKATSAASLSRDAVRAPRGPRPRACTETPRTEPGRSHARPRPDGAGVRDVNPRKTTSMHVRGKSDRPIVPEKPANNEACVERVSAESVEGRGLAKGNRIRQTRFRTQCRGRAEYGEP